MNVTLLSAKPNGSLRAIASKSAAHRLLICAAFATRPTIIRCEQTGEDIEATIHCLRALGATITKKGCKYCVEPISSLPREVTLPCRESGSTMRFLVPIVASLGISARFVMEGRLPNRPLSPLREELESHGITFSTAGSNPLLVSGKLSGESFSIRGDVSSQFISGMLFALSFGGKGGEIRLTTPLESAPYVDMTCDALRRFGYTIETEADCFVVSPIKKETHLDDVVVEGDWSNAAFVLAAAAMGGKITMTGLDLHSHQGDRAILTLLRQFGAIVEENESSVTVSRAPLHGIKIDATQIPDLVPILATIASVADGETVIYGASRLRIKESDRLFTTTRMLTTLGADVTETEDGLIIRGKERLPGGTVSAEGDHRIAMSAAVAGVVCAMPVTITGAEATAKSYPDFFEDISAIGFAIEKNN